MTQFSPYSVGNKHNPYSVGNKHITQRRIEIMKRRKKKVTTNRMGRGRGKHRRWTLVDWFVSRKPSCFFYEYYCGYKNVFVFMKHLSAGHTNTNWYHQLGDVIDSSMFEIEVLSFCLGNKYKWQCNKKCLISSGAQRQSHQSLGVSRKLCVVLWCLRRLKPTLNWNRCLIPCGSWTPNVDFEMGRIRLKIFFLKST